MRAAGRADSRARTVHLRCAARSSRRAGTDTPDRNAVRIGDRVETPLTPDWRRTPSLGQEAQALPSRIQHFLRGTSLVPHKSSDFRMDANRRVLLIMALQGTGGKANRPRFIRERKDGATSICSPGRPESFRRPARRNWECSRAKVRPPAWPAKWVPQKTISSAPSWPRMSI